MTMHRHATNLRVPFERVDLGFLAALPDYRIGAPIPGNADTSLSSEQLREHGYVGLYITPMSLNDPLVKKLTGGWTEKTLGEAWRP